MWHMLAHAGASGPGSSVGDADVVQQHLMADTLRKVEEELKEVAAEVKRADVELVQATSAAKANHMLIEHLQKRFDYLVAEKAQLLDTRRDLIAKLPNSAGGCCKRFASLASCCMSIITWSPVSPAVWSKRCCALVCICFGIACCVVEAAVTEPR
jgi:hypothetical protein